MKRRTLFICLSLAALAAACPFDASLREYLDARFWLPFAKQARQFERPNVRRIDAAFAGMTKDKPDTPLGKLRAAYQSLSSPDDPAAEAAKLQTLVAAARADSSLTARDREEIDLLDAKIDLRLGSPELPGRLNSARTKLQKFLATARTPEFLSEARGWLARADYLSGEQTAAGKIYLDELNRNGSNLSRETILTSLKITYGHDGGAQLREHLAEYFDTPEHAAFAISMTTNPHWDRYDNVTDQQRANQDAAKQYARIRELLGQHAALFQSPEHSRELTLLSMRTALRMGDPPGALSLAALVPADSSVRQQPDFEWMLASANFLAHEYAAAEGPLLALFRSKQSTPKQKSAAAYGLCGVYRKIVNPVEQLHYALWLRSANTAVSDEDADDVLRDVYWDASGFDLNLLLESEASIDDLKTFLEKHPAFSNNRLVRYALAVRLARLNHYAESAEIYQSIGALRRAPRMRRLGELYDAAQRRDLTPGDSQQARFRLAEFIGANENGIYFNDSLWNGLQRYALTADDDARLTREERETGLAQERQLKDDQEERWRAYLILRDVVKDAGHAALGRQSALLALDDLVRINPRFGRAKEIQAALRDLRHRLAKN